MLILLLYDNYKYELDRKKIFFTILTFTQKKVYITDLYLKPQHSDCSLGNSGLNSFICFHSKMCVSVMLEALLFQLKTHNIKKNYIILSKYSVIIIATKSSQISQIKIIL